MAIEVRKPREGELEQLGVSAWPIWSCEISTFDWTYGERETCYLLEGAVVVEAEGQTVRLNAGDLVVFPEGLSCVWQVIAPVRKHYCFG